MSESDQSVPQSGPRPPYRPYVSPGENGTQDGTAPPPWEQAAVVEDQTLPPVRTAPPRRAESQGQQSQGSSLSSRATTWLPADATPPWAPAVQESSKAEPPKRAESTQAQTPADASAATAAVQPAPIAGPPPAQNPQFTQPTANLPPGPPPPQNPQLTQPTANLPPGPPPPQNPQLTQPTANLPPGPPPPQNPQLTQPTANLTPGPPPQWSSPVPGQPPMTEPTLHLLGSPSPAGAQPAYPGFAPPVSQPPPAAPVLAPLPSPGGPFPVTGAPAPGGPWPMPAPPQPAGRPSHRHRRTRVWPRDRNARLLVVLAGCVAVAAVIYLVLPGPARTAASPAPGLAAQPLSSSAVDADSLFSSDPAATDTGFTTTMTDVAAYGGTVVAVGEQTATVLDGGAGRGIFLVSRNAGRTWRLASLTAPSGQGADLVAGGPAGWVALDQDYASASGSEVGAVWTSRNGESWAEFDSGAATAAFNGDTVDSVAATSSGFVADGQTVSGRALVWVSRDGRSWHRIEPPLTAAPAAAESLAAHGNQVVAFAGTAASPSFWHSPDGGQTWQQVRLPPLGALTAVSYAGVAAGPSGLYIYGSADDQSLSTTVALLLASSPAGAAWSVLADSPAPDGLAMNLLAAGTAGFAAGFAAGTNEDLYRSSGGTSWRASGSIAGGAAGESTIAAQGASVAMTGLADRPGGGQPVPYLAAGRSAVTTVNLAAIPGVVPAARAANAVAVAGDQTVVAGAANGTPGIWYNTTPADPVWQRAGVPEVAGALSSVTDGSAGWLAVGPGTQTSPSTQLTVLTSANGREWQQAPDAAAFGVQQGGYSAVDPSGVSSGEDGYMVAGTAFRGSNTADYTAVTWFSANLGSWTGPVAMPTSLLDSGIASIAGGDFGFVAVGFGVDAGNGEVATEAWLSGDDGRTWTPLSPPLPGGASDPAFGQVTSTGNTIVVFGTARQSGHSFAFTDVSRNAGRTWQEAKVPDSAGVTGVSAAAVTSAGAAASYTAQASGRQFVMLVSSGTLSSWTARVAEGPGLSGPGRNLISGLALRGTTVIGVGMTSGPVTTNTTLWQVSMPR